MTHPRIFSFYSGVHLELKALAINSVVSKLLLFNVSKSCISYDFGVWQNFEIVTKSITCPLYNLFLKGVCLQMHRGNLETTDLDCLLI